MHIGIGRQPRDHQTSTSICHIGGQEGTGRERIQILSESTSPSVYLVRGAVGGSQIPWLGGERWRASPWEVRSKFQEFLSDRRALL